MPIVQIFSDKRPVMILLVSVLILWPSWPQLVGLHGPEVGEYFPSYCG